jgi:hypothetical protein
MGLSKSKQQTKSTETLAPSTYSQPFVNDAASTLRPAFDQSQGLLDKYIPQTQQGIDYYSKTLNGDYLDHNPYLDRMISDTNQSIADSVNSQFSGARFGSGYHARTLADRIAQNENNVRGQQYNTERGYQNEAALRKQGLIESTVGLPQTAAGNYAGGVGGLLGKYATSTGSTTTQQRPSLLSLLAQGAQAGASAFGGR